jgi:hypothetical protein
MASSCASETNMRFFFPVTGFVAQPLIIRRLMIRIFFPATMAGNLKENL